ncbi:16018_t:CDS:2, partial [Racocetra fulgida]
WFSQLGTQIGTQLGNAIKSFVPENIIRDRQVLSAFDHVDDLINDTINRTDLHPELNLDATDRKNFIREAFAKYIGVDISEVHPDDIPTMAFMGSGGGFRAMIVVTGLSGSCWNLAMMYTSLARSSNNHPLDEVLDYYRKKLTHSITDVRGVFRELASNVNPKAAVAHCFGGLHQKKLTEAKVRIMDLFGALLATKIMLGPDATNQHNDFKLSQQAKYFEVRPWKDSLDEAEQALVENYAEVWAKYKEVDDHFQWYEVTPYEMGTEEVAAYIPTWAFGRKFESGKSITKTPEQNLSLMIGVDFNLLFSLFGSAPSAPLLFEINQLELALGNGWAKTEFKNLYEHAMKKMGEDQQRIFEGHQPVPPPKNHNFLYHLDPPPYKLGVTNSKTLSLMDAGVSNDSPVYPMTRPARKIDIVIGFDCSSVIVGRELFDKEQKEFCATRGFEHIERDKTNQYCEIHDYTPNGKTNGYCPPAEHPFTMCYFPYLPNDKVDPKFIPATEKFMAFNNFTYTTEQVNKTIQLAKQNWKDGEQKVKEVVIEVWKKKKAARL